MKNITKFLFVAAVIFMSQESFALSCLRVPNSVGRIDYGEINIKQNTSGSQTFTIKDRKYISFDRSISNIDEYKKLHNQYRDGDIPEKDIISHEYSFELNLPSKFSHLISENDIVVNGAPLSRAACGGPGTYAIFDGESGELKILYYQAAGYNSEYDFGGIKITAGPVGKTEDNTEVLFKTKDDKFSLSAKESYFFDDNTQFYLSSIKNKTDEIWFGAPYISLLMAFDEGLKNEEALCDISYTGLIKYGSRGANVKALQNCLNILGYNTGFIDGKYGPKTFAGIKKFQKSQGISQDGIVGPVTISYLNKK